MRLTECALGGLVLLTVGGCSLFSADAAPEGKTVEPEPQNSTSAAQMVLPKVTLSAELQARIKAFTPPDTGEWIQKAYRRQIALKASQKYEQLLIEFCWLYNNATFYRPEYVGVVNSFLLSGVTDIMERYAPAKELLLLLRDVRVYKLLTAKNFDTADPAPDELKIFCPDKVDLRRCFSDAASLNRVLKMEDATIELFRELDKRSPEFAGRVYFFVEKLLGERREKALLSKYFFGKPDKKLTPQEIQDELLNRWRRIKQDIEAQTSIEHCRKVWDGISKELPPQENNEAEKNVAIRELVLLELVSYRNFQIKKLLNIADALGEHAIAKQVSAESDALLRGIEAKINQLAPAAK